MTVALQRSDCRFFVLNAIVAQLWAIGDRRYRFPAADSGVDAARHQLASHRVNGRRRRRCYGLRVFTGLVEAVGHIQARTESALGQRILVKSDLGTWALGESVAVNGVCLTVCEGAVGGFYADISAETLSRSSLGRLAMGSAVNLERALRVGDRLGGHWVSGHVDAVIQLLHAVHVGEAIRLTFELPEDLVPYVAPKGSVAVEGVSLTVNEVSRDRFSVMIIPHTQQGTTLDRTRPGDSLNLEVDVIARYVVNALSHAAMLGGADAAPHRDTDLHQALVRAGFMNE